MTDTQNTWFTDRRDHLYPSPMRLLVATSNAGKLRDFAHAARSFDGVEIMPLPGIETIPAPEETADTFAGNALIKALDFSALAPGEIVLADDSGIVVPGLGGAPGVRSARYADDLGWLGAGNSDARNNACLLHQAGQLTNRAASYACALCAVRDRVLLATGVGELHGVLRREPRGVSGFGYDPLFELPELGLTMAEVDPATRLAISHRGGALVDVVRKLEVQLSDFAQSQR